LSVERIFNIHFGEIALKGKNRRIFEQKLIDNIKSATGSKKIKSVHGRLLLYPENKDSEGIAKALEKTFGIEWFSESFYTGNSLEELSDVIIKGCKNLKESAIKLETKRSDKTYPLTSPEINQKVGLTLEKSGFKVDLKNPQKIIYIEILKDSAVISTDKKRGLGGLPVGSSGRVLSLLSGGIDSPVASWLMMKRGCTVDFLHLHAFPTNEKAMESKIIPLVKKLKEYHPPKIKLFLVPYGAFYEKSFEISPKNELVVFRRFILHIANRLAEKNGYLGFVTGDSIGQVASQTIENLYTTNEAADYPVYRPLIGYDKKEIIDLAERIGTYQISIEKYKDCCSLVAEKHPSTKVKLETARMIEKNIRIEEVVDKAIQNMSVVEF